ncbi:MAG TPA: DUF6714 family protein [Blastocatellia bacterium]|nr:DUF6714 family protein [Blastocatellia bacterium]
MNFSLFNELDFEKRHDELIAEIIAVFDGVSREDGITLHEAAAIDDRLSDEEQLAARRLDTEQRWQDVPDDDILACPSALSFLDVKGFRYYLPAFMIYDLKNWNNTSCDFHLLHESGKSLRKSEPASITGKYGFTNAQCRVAAKFLRFVVGDEAPVATLKAVEKWEKFVQELDHERTHK